MFGVNTKTCLKCPIIRASKDWEPLENSNKIQFFPRSEYRTRIGGFVDNTSYVTRKPHRTHNMEYITSCVFLRFVYHKLQIIQSIFISINHLHYFFLSLLFSLAPYFAYVISFLFVWCFAANVFFRKLSSLNFPSDYKDYNEQIYKISSRYKYSRSSEKLRTHRLRLVCVCVCVFHFIWKQRANNKSHTLRRLKKRRLITRVNRKFYRITIVKDIVITFTLANF